MTMVRKKFLQASPVRFSADPGGCTTYLLDSQGNVITKFSVSRDIVIDKKAINRFKDLFIYSGGKFRIVTHNGKTYLSNPSIFPALNVVPGDDLPRALNFVQEPYPWFTFLKLTVEEQKSLTRSSVP
jgi:hypothetical protein